MNRRSVLDRNLPHDSALKAAAREQSAEPKRGRSDSAFWSRPSTEAAMRILDVAAAVMWHREFGCGGTPNLEWLNGRDEREIRLIEYKPAAGDLEADAKAGITKARGIQWQFFSGSEEEWTQARADDAKADQAVWKAEKIRGGEKHAEWQRRQKEARLSRRQTPKTLTSDTTNPATTRKWLAAAEVFELIVSRVMGELGSTATLRGLVLHRFPRAVLVDLDLSEEDQKRQEQKGNPYARDEIERSYRRFRPVIGSPEMGDQERKALEAYRARNPHLKYTQALHMLMGNMGGRHIQGLVDALLRDMERELIQGIAGCWRDVKDMEELVGFVQEAAECSRCHPRLPVKDFGGKPLEEN